ncbi:hypothetical protein OBBRIDRAFT_778895 [Obba rivulosa]|uniref:Uncharacterized protein n=1 Tax=Obba rivulosa TaxID=1052685 RepID=A0A8E2AYY0_9APHY|nr:hypothetical protein OBBRIDRAFT_778895 [Obba rivulosa]
MTASSGAGGDKPYPEQMHAGAVGYGPNYGTGPTTGDKLEGMVNEMKGKMIRDPELVEYGREMRTGELKERQKEDDMHEDRGGTPDVPKSDTNQTTAQPPSVEDTAHPSEKGQREQAATVAPEGTDDAEVQRRGSATENTKYIG